MKGKIVQVSGPVVDVEFEGSYLPAIKDALYVIQDGKKKTMEVSQHIGNNVVRCIMLAASEGLCKDMEVTATGSGISVPVGEKTLGRLFNVLGDTLDNGEKLDEEARFIANKTLKEALHGLTLEEYQKLPKRRKRPNLLMRPANLRHPRRTI